MTALIQKYQPPKAWLSAWPIISTHLQLQNRQNRPLFDEWRVGGWRGLEILQARPPRGASTKAQLQAKHFEYARADKDLVHLGLW
jgi:hypothetical protein